MKDNVKKRNKLMNESEEENKAVEKAVKLGWMKCHN